MNMAKLKGLGRGLDALLGNSQSSPKNEPRAALDQPTQLNIDQLKPGPYQPRSFMDTEQLKSLSESIKSQGIIQPILVRLQAENQYEIIAGERRWRAARMGGLNQVPVVIRDMPDAIVLQVALIENIQREDLNPLEEALGVERLIKEFGLTHLLAAEALGRSRAAISNLLRLLELAPPVRQLLMEGKMDMGHARPLLALPAADQVALAHQIVEKALSAREVERRVGAIVSRPPPRVPRTPDRDVARLQEELAQLLGTTLLIKQKTKGRGQLIIDYANLDVLDLLIQKLRS